MADCNLFHERQVMVDAHTDAVMILGETLQDEAPYSFEGQSTTQRIQRLLPTMVAHRMCPPPDEVGHTLLMRSVIPPCAVREDKTLLYKFTSCNNS